MPVVGWLGAAAFGVGMGLLGIGALATGILNNIYPKKFKPRNGDLGVDRLNIASSQQVIQEIQQRQNRKTVLKQVAPLFKGGPEVARQKAWYKFLSAMPEAADFLPKRLLPVYFAVKRRLFNFLPATGSQASVEKHRINVETIQAAHLNPKRSLYLQEIRVAALKTLVERERRALPSARFDQAGTAATYPTGHHAMLQRSWALLKALQLEKSVLKTWINSGFMDRSHHIAGFDQKADHWHTFDFNNFVSKSDEQALNGFNAAVDYFLFYSHLKSMRYQVYGLNDFFWQLRRLEEKG